MTSNEFVIWLRGFMEACNDFAPTPKQWDRIKEELDNVSDKVLELYPVQENPYKSPYQPPYWVGDPPGWLNQYITSGTTPLTGSVFVSSSSSHICTALGQTGTTRFDLTNLPPGTNITYTNKINNKDEDKLCNNSL